MCKIFIVDDDNFFGGMLQYHLQLNPAYKVPLPTNTKDCISNAYLYNPRSYSETTCRLNASLYSWTGGDVFFRFIRVTNFMVF